MKDFFAQLKQWRVYRLAVSYAAAAWLILQLTIALREPLGLPAWTLTLVIGVLMVGFSVALWVGWMQDHRTVLPDGRTVPRSRRHHFAVALISLLPSVLVAAGFLLFHRPARGGVGAPDEPSGPVSAKSIAVLPFESRSSDTENTYFAEGIQDEILTDLARVADLKVISQGSVMVYRPAGPRNLREIGRALGVAHLVEGSVQRALGKVRVTARLIEARTDVTLWAHSYDGDLADIFAIQSKMAEQIAAGLQARLSPDEKRAIDARPTADPEAFDLYLQAKELLREVQGQKDYRASLLRALRLLDAARARDPDFAEAACLTARAHDQMYYLEFDHTSARLAMAEAAVSEALRLRPDLGEAHLARAMLFLHGSLDYDAARKALAEARKTLPNSAEVLDVTSFLDRRQGDWQGAVRHGAAALALDPHNPSIRNDLIVDYDELRMYREEEQVVDAGFAAAPQEGPFFRLMKAEISLEDGRLDDCRKALAAMAGDPDPGGGAMMTRVNLALYERHCAEAAQALAESKLESFFDLNGTLTPSSCLAGLIARAAGETDKARAAMLAARATVEENTRGQPEDATTLALLGRIDAALGRKDDALREGRRAVELRPVAADRMGGPLMESALALIYAWTGEPDQALGLLGPLSRNPAGPTYGELRYDPAWDALRGDPRFEQLVAAMPK